MKRYILISCVGSLIVACSSTPKYPGPSEVQPDTVVARLGNLSSRPEWVNEFEQAPFQIKDGMVYSLGQTSIPGEHRIEAGYRVAENSAKASISGAIEQRLDFIQQIAEEGTSIDGTQIRYIGAEASRITTSSMRPSKRYYEKVATTSDTGQRTTRYLIYSLVEMPERDFKSALLDAIKNRQGKSSLSADFAEKVADHWQDFVKGNNSNTRIPSNVDASSEAKDGQ